MNGHDFRTMRDVENVDAESIWFPHFSETLSTFFITPLNHPSPSFSSLSTNRKIHNLNLFLHPVVEYEEVAFTIPWNLSFGWSNLLSADEPFVDDVLLLLHLLHHHKVMDGSSTSGDRSSNIVGGFFYATLLLWLGSVWYYILFNNRVDLLFIITGSVSSTKQLIGSYDSFSLETLFL